MTEEFKTAYRAIMEVGGVYVTVFNIDFDTSRKDENGNIRLGFEYDIVEGTAPDDIEEFQNKIGDQLVLAIQDYLEGLNDK